MIPDLAKVISCYAICRERFELEGQINIVENIERISEIELKSLSENPSLRDYCFARYVLSFANLVSWFMDFIREEFPEARLGDVKEYEKAFAQLPSCGFRQAYPFQRGGRVMFELMYLIALPSLFLLVLCGLYGLTTWFSMQKEKALTKRQSRAKANGKVVPPTEVTNLSVYGN